MKNRKVLWTIEKNYIKGKRYNHDTRRMIGKTLEASRTHMYPNDNYREIFPEDYQALLKKRPSPSSQSIGMYSILKNIVETLPLYDTLDEVFGREDTNLILDYAMYQIISESAVSQHYEVTLSRNKKIIGPIPISDEGSGREE